MNDALTLRYRAEGLQAPLPPLLAHAERLAATVLLGDHGRRRAGMGDEFWQYRPASPTDGARAIDWRRSAQSDVHFVREREWQAVQTVAFWADRGQSMQFSSAKGLPTKADRAALLSLALAVCLGRAGERVGLLGAVPPRIGRGQLLRIAEALSEPAAGEYAPPETLGLPPRARAIFVSDFFGDPDRIQSAVARAADQGVHGLMLMVLDPQEEAFPFKGRTIFESMSGALEHETQKAGELRDRYLDRLARRKARLDDLAHHTGWHFHVHHTDQSPEAALLWLYRATEGDG